MAGKQKAHESRPVQDRWGSGIVQVLADAPELLLPLIGVFSLLTVLPMYQAVQFLREPAPLWAYVLAAAWVALAARCARHLAKHRLDRRDLVFLGLHLLGSLVTVAVTLYSAWDAA